MGSRGRPRKTDGSNKWHSQMKETLCWECKWATGLDGVCPWAKDGTPVDGWKAKKTKIKSATELRTNSFKVIECPLFCEG